MIFVHLTASSDVVFSMMIWIWESHFFSEVRGIFGLVLLRLCTGGTWVTWMNMGHHGTVFGGISYDFMSKTWENFGSECGKPINHHVNHP